MVTRNRRNKRIKRRKPRTRRQRGGAKLSYCIYSNSTFSDILQIQFDYLSKIFKGGSQDIYLFTDKPFEGKTDVSYKTVLYNDGDPYMQRLKTCIEQIPTEYFILTHDNDILIQYNKLAIESVVDKMVEMNIDSVLLKNTAEGGPRIKVTDTLSLWQVPEGFGGLRYCVQPNIWKKEGAMKLFSSNAAKNYRRSENPNVQEYVKNNLSSYQLSSETVIKSWYVGCERATPEYVFIHVTKVGYFFPKTSVKGVTVDPIVQKELDHIQQTYIDIPTAGRKQADAATGIIPPASGT